MKKIIAIAAAIAALFVTSSCVQQEGDFMYDVEISFFDNFDVLSRSFDKAFESAGCTNVSGHWMLKGEKNSCDKKVKEAFLARAKDIDLNRDAQEGMVKLLDLKGETVKLKAQWGTDKYELASYTFTK